MTVSPVPGEDTHAAAERRTALRASLMSPLLTDENAADDLLLVRRHREHLVRLCAEGFGYRLVVEPKTARLCKAEKLSVSASHSALFTMS